MTAIGKTLGHVKYIQHRPGEDREPGGREMFNDQEDRLDPKAMRKAIRELGDAKVIAHKLTLAPEVSPEDKKAYTREVMKNLSREKGSDLEWFAVAHDNTDHHHIHVVVLGKDRNGIEVNISLRDIEKTKEFGDRYLERCHPREFERARELREEKERERLDLRQQEKDERIREGLELPWMKRNIVREQLEPYEEWQKQKDKERKGRSRKHNEPERPYHNDTIEAAGEKWSRANSLKELQGLNEHLWDTYEDRIPVDEYKKLTGWIRDKESAKQRDSRDQGPGKSGEEREQKDYFEHDGKTYKSKDSYEKLTGLARELRENKERLPVDDYHNLRSWIEDRDRARFSGAISKEMDRVIKRDERSKTMEDHKAAEGGRVLNPVQEQVMSTPFIGLWMQFASVANQIVRAIPLDDRNRDYTKEQRDGLEDSKKALDEREKERSIKGVKMPWEDFDNMLGMRYSRTEHDRNKELEQRENIDKAIDKNKEQRDKEREKEAERKREKDRSPFERDPWGRW